MKTDDFITMLSTGAHIEELGPNRGKFHQSIGLGAIGSTFIMLGLLHVNPELGTVMQSLPFWEKLGFAGSIAIVSLSLVKRLSKPGVAVAHTLFALTVPILSMWALAAIVLLDADAQARAALFFGNTWAVCPFLITMLSVPVFAMTLLAMRDFAPTRLREAGAAAGLFSGSVGAFVYCFHCPELDAPFIAFWYLLGMLIPASIGALIGRKLLHW